MPDPYFFIFVCLRPTTAFFPRGQLPREDLRRSPLPPRPLVTPGPCLTFSSLSPVLLSCILHQVRTLPCPVHITYRVSGLSLPCFPVLHIYSNPTERNPSTHIKPHTQTVLIHYFNQQTIKTTVYHYIVSPPVSSYLFQRTLLTPCSDSLPLPLAA